MLPGLWGHSFHQFQQIDSCFLFTHVLSVISLFSFSGTLIKHYVSHLIHTCSSLNFSFIASNSFYLPAAFSKCPQVKLGSLIFCSAVPTPLQGTATACFITTVFLL